MTSVGALEEPSEEALRSAPAIGAPELAGLPLRINPRPPSANPLYWSSSAVVGESFVVKFAWSEVRAVRLWREGVIFARLKTMDPLLAIPDLVALKTPGAHGRRPTGSSSTAPDPPRGDPAQGRDRDATAPKACAGRPSIGRAERRGRARADRRPKIIC